MPVVFGKPNSTVFALRSVSVWIIFFHENCPSANTYYFKQSNAYTVRSHIALRSPTMVYLPLLRAMTSNNSIYDTNTLRAKLFSYGLTEV